MLMGLLSKAATVAMLSFVVSSMLAMGAGLTVPQIAEPLRNVRLVVPEAFASSWIDHSGRAFRVMKTSLQVDAASMSSVIEGRAPRGAAGSR